MELQPMNEEGYKKMLEGASNELKILEDKLKQINRNYEKQKRIIREERISLTREIREKKRIFESIQNLSNQLITGKLPERKKKEEKPKALNP
jgi:hypothetical protein